MWSRSSFTFIKTQKDTEKRSLIDDRLRYSPCQSIIYLRWELNSSGCGCATNMCSGANSNAQPHPSTAPLGWLTSITLRKGSWIKCEWLERIPVPTATEVRRRKKIPCAVKLPPQYIEPCWTIDPFHLNDSLIPLHSPLHRSFVRCSKLPPQS